MSGRIIRPTRPVATSLGDRPRLIRRLGVREVPPGTSELRWPGWRFRLTESTSAGLVFPSPTALTIHALLQANEPQATLSINGTPSGVRPGDCLTAAAGAAIAISPYQLLAIIEASPGDGAIPPHHGEEAFFGYNRRTRYITPPGMLLERWKITAVGELPALPARSLIIGIYGELALTALPTIGRVGAGVAWEVAAEGALRVVPNGLAYVLRIMRR